MKFNIAQVLRNRCFTRLNYEIIKRSNFTNTAISLHGSKRLPPGEGIPIHFITAEGDRVTVGAREGESVLDVAHANDVELEGACESSLACSTCHVILEEEIFDKLEEPTDEENDMLDLAFGLTETSRLGCQVLIIKELENATFKIPSATRNMAVDGKDSSLNPIEIGLDKYVGSGKVL